MLAKHLSSWSPRNSPYGFSAQVVWVFLTAWWLEGKGWVFQLTRKRLHHLLWLGLENNILVEAIHYSVLTEQSAAHVKFKGVRGRGDGTLTPPFKKLFKFIFIFWLHQKSAGGILVPWPRVEPKSPAVEVQSLNHWITKEVSDSTSFFFFNKVGFIYF